MDVEGYVHVLQPPGLDLDIGWTRIEERRV
jgi:hypothetical protein